MIKVTASSYIKEECLEEYFVIVKELVEKSNLDPGCVKYELCRDVNDPLHFVMLEDWENQELLDEHLKSAHFLELVPKLGTLAVKPSELTILEKMF